MVTDVLALTWAVVITNVADLSPAAMFTLDGTLAMFGLELARKPTVPGDKQPRK